MKIATSLVLALLNLLLVGIFWGLSRMNYPEAAIVVEMVILPSLLLATFAFLTRDLIKSGNRLQAFLASLLSIPTVLLVSSIRLR
jgi:chromate transport protein ChrA